MRTSDLNKSGTLPLVSFSQYSCTHLDRVLSLSDPPLQACTAVTGQRPPTARVLAGKSWVLWVQNKRSWMVWSRSVALSPSLRTPCGSVSLAVHTFHPHQRRRPPILSKWTVPNCTVAPRPTPHAAGTAPCSSHHVSNSQDTHVIQYAETYWVQEWNVLDATDVTLFSAATGTCVRTSAQSGAARSCRTLISTVNTTRWRRSSSTAWLMSESPANWAART